ncbi:hypothetical protein [Bradyrhizobium sp. 199]|uniref:hypothetical protein n=1 Tax=Bradyrhizobium sp. 199 TaxID=2782664 RepID=UPI001FFB4877|nr:hypothetical protein [Bradyrhizobium sp. 199]
MQEQTTDDRIVSGTIPSDRARLLLILACHVACCCVSLLVVVDSYGVPLRLAAIDGSRVWAAAINVAAFAAVAPIFAFARFSFGYALGFYFYTMILGYLWLVAFSTFPYNHAMASVSAFASALAFMAPVLLINSPAKPRFALTPDALNKLLSFILAVAVAVIAAGAIYNFRFVSFSDMSTFRDELKFPRALEYAIGITSGALLPFAFACFLRVRMRLRATLCLVLLALFWPITLSKTSLFAPLWLMFLVGLSRILSIRMAVIASLLLPLALGVLAAALYARGLLPERTFYTYFGTVNFRMAALTSSALDFYNDYFSRNDLMYFCQIGLIKSFVTCAHQEQLSVVMQNAYHIGNFNASLFATEGIASVGMTFAPLAALGCGLLISLGNRASAGLPGDFVLISGGMMLNILMNVPLSVALVTHGALILSLLWYVTPRGRS